MKQIASCVLALFVASPQLAAESEPSSFFVEDGLHVSGGHFESSSLGFVTACGYEPNRSKLDILQHGNVVATIDIPGFSAKGISVFDIADLEEPANEFSFFVSGATGKEQYISRLYRWSAQVLELLWSSEHLGLDSAPETGCEISTNGSGTLWLSLCKTDQSLDISVGRFSEYEAFYHTNFEISSTPRGDETFDYPSIAVINDEPRKLRLALLWDGRITILGTPEQPRLANLATPPNPGTLVWHEELKTLWLHAGDKAYGYQLPEKFPPYSEKKLAYDIVLDREMVGGSIVEIMPRPDATLVIRANPPGRGELIKLARFTNGDLKRAHLQTLDTPADSGGFLTAYTLLKSQRGDGKRSGTIQIREFSDR